MFFVSYSFNVRLSLPLMIDCLRPKFVVDANHQQKVLMLTPSCVVAVDVLINGQVLSTQAHRSALTHFVTCPPLVPMLLIYEIASVRAFTELSSRCFQVPTLMPFSIRVHKRILRRGNTQPLCFVIHGLNSTWRQDYRFNKIILSQHHHRVSQHPNQTEDVCQPVSPLGPMEP